MGRPSRNRADLLRELAGLVAASATDVAIVAAAYMRWGLDSLPKLVGDWALSIWDSAEQQLVLAKDFLGTRSLFYSVHPTSARWCTVLDPLVLLAGRRFSLNREYLAGWFGLFPAAHLTPYAGVYSVPPASYVIVRKHSVETKEFWRFTPSETLVYRNDADYEKHFLQLFEQAVERRLRSASPVLAELSGGMDSSSIVCMADRTLGGRGAGAPRLDTITYHSPVEPNWNELPYVEKVEAQRGRAGYRIEVGSDNGFHFDSDVRDFMATPGSLNSPGKSGREFSRVLRKAEAAFSCPASAATKFSEARPRPFHCSQIFWPRGVCGHFQTNSSPGGSLSVDHSCRSWPKLLRCSAGKQTPTRSVPPPGRGFAQISSATISVPSMATRAARAYSDHDRVFKRTWVRSTGCAGNFELSSVKRTCLPQELSVPGSRPSRVLVSSFPPDQLLRPGQRRSLMRRALAGIVPPELLHRKRKAFVIRRPLMAITSQFASLAATTQEMAAGSLGIFDSRALAATLHEVRSGGVVNVPSLTRVFAIERWLRNAAHWNVLEGVDGCEPKPTSPANAAVTSPGCELKTSLS